MPSSHRRKIDFLRSVWYVSLCQYTRLYEGRYIIIEGDTKIPLSSVQPLTRLSPSQKSALYGFIVLESTSTKKVKYGFTLQLYSFTALQLYSFTPRLAVPRFSCGSGDQPA